MQEEEKTNNSKVITFGCRLNSYESEVIKEAIKDLYDQNILVFNSCSVTSQAERDLRSVLRKARRENPDARIVVTGCAAQINPEKYAKMAEVDLVLGNQEKLKKESYLNLYSSNSHYQKLPKDSDLHKDNLFFTQRDSAGQLISSDEEAKIKVNDIMSVKETAPQLVSYFENRIRAFLEIQNGCNHRCTFCIIPFGRGNSRSVAFGEIVTQAKKMVELGHQEIVLTGVDISDYGIDLPAKLTLSQMIKRLLKLVPELKRLRLSSIDVAEIDDGIFELLANEPRFMPYFHLSVQSGDDLILKRMARRHNRSQIIEFCQRARKINPKVTFGADIIAGFPTESDEAFQNSLSLISEADLIFTHIFPYSKRAGTPAAKMPQLNGNIIKERARALREAGAKQFEKYLNSQTGSEFEILIEKDGMGKSENFLDVKIVGEARKNATSNQLMKVIAKGVEGGKYLVAEEIFK